MGMKRWLSCYFMLSLGIFVLSFPEWGWCQGDSDSLVSSKLDSLTREIEQLKSEIEALKASERKGLGRLIPRPASTGPIIESPEEIDRITLVNGTMVFGDILRRDKRSVIVETDIGILNLKWIQIKEVDRVKRAAKCILLGKILARRDPDTGKRVLVGKIKNKGSRRADFVQIKFNFLNAKAETVGIDSAYVDGTRHTFRSGVITDTCIRPNEYDDFKCFISQNKYPGESNYFYTIKWKEYD
ncbi:hypothetical protein ISS37_10015 [candidate division KSB1 bacterium]|nr:hypothetical protein [candidate division KSB1 bacterium]